MVRAKGRPRASCVRTSTTRAPVSDVEVLTQLALGRRVHFDRQTLPREVIHDRQAAKPAPIDQPIVHKVHRPAFVRPCGGGQGAPRDPATLGPPALDPEPGFPVEPVDPRPVYRIAPS